MNSQISQRSVRTQNMLHCTLCKRKGRPLLNIQDGHVCEDCAQSAREGHDHTTRTAKSLQRALRDQADIERLAQQSGDAPDEQVFKAEVTRLLVLEDLSPTQQVARRGAGGEVLQSPSGTPRQSRDTLSNPGIAALDASAHRIDLLDSLGVQSVALAVDAADSIGAQDSMERMLAHQMAVLHKTALECAHKAAVTPDADRSMRMLGAMNRCMQTFQSGLLTLKKFRASGEQSIVVQHVNVTDGGQAVIGSVQTRGHECK